MSQPTWQQLWLDVPAAAAPRCEAALEKAGALSVTMTELGDQPVLEPRPGEKPLWDLTRVTGLFTADISPDTLFARLSPDLEPAWLEKLGHNYLEDEDWVRKTQADFSAEKLGQRSWVIPAWEETPAGFGHDDIAIRIDPGLAFGTGKHETTRLCLQWLEDHTQPGQHWLDYGCGSGVLAIAALKFGAQKATGVDIDPQALKATRNNAGLNSLDEQKLTCFLPEQTPKQLYDGLVANILAPILIELAEQLTAQLKPGARFALSGVLREQAEAVAAAWCAAGCQIEAFEYLNDWALISGFKPT
ncbi:MAG TPA: 50S ribosomal protein L11 methyltransferase [Halothiobacillaceae bacterium]|nr:50S ribosomal protein L11 methyltransferase [Halothiobacillaceae bacterium]